MRGRLEKLEKNLEKFNKLFQQWNIEDMSYLTGNKLQLIWRNFLAGIARGVGIGIGVTIITAILIIFLRKIIMLNIPVIGDYLSDIVDIMEKNKELH